MEKTKKQKREKEHDVKDLQHKCPDCGKRLFAWLECSSGDDDDDPDAEKWHVECSKCPYSYPHTFENLEWLRMEFIIKNDPWAE